MLADSRTTDARDAVAQAVGALSSLDEQTIQYLYDRPHRLLAAVQEVLSEQQQRAELARERDQEAFSLAATSDQLRSVEDRIRAKSTPRIEAAELAGEAARLRVKGEETEAQPRLQLVARSSG